MDSGRFHHPTTRKVRWSRATPTWWPYRRSRRAVPLGDDLPGVFFATAWPGTPLFATLEKEGRANRNWDQVRKDVPSIQFKHFTHSEDGGALPHRRGAQAEPDRFQPGRLTASLGQCILFPTSTYPHVG